MKSVLAIRHVHFEDLGIFEEVFADAGYTVRYCEAGVDGFAALDSMSPDVLAVLGGPIGAYESETYPFLLDEMDILKRRIERRLPTLGICLGAQLIAHSLGAPVYPASAKEIGWSELTVTAEGLGGPLASFDGVPVLHWHGDTFALPAGALRLASTAITQNQAFEIGPEVLAFQFHPEVTPHGFERWLIGHACEIAATPGVSVSGLRADMREFGAASAARGHACLTAWLARLGAHG